MLSPLILCCLAATWLIWGSTYLVLRFALVGFPPFFLMATRFVAAGGLLLAWRLARGARLPTAREWRSALVVGTLMLGGGMGGVAYAEQTIASGLVVSFIAVTPLLLVLINVGFGVYPGRRELLAVCVGLAGVLMLTRGSGLRGSPAGRLVARQRAQPARLRAGAGRHRICHGDAVRGRRDAHDVRARG
jgi:drug/metabolite transporter (DMT)-like permease